MSRRGSWVKAYAVVRVDRGRSGDPDATSPPQPAADDAAFTVKEVVMTAEEAIREVDRLNGLREGDRVRYFWSGTRLFLDGGSFGRQPD